jgi:signal peptidase I
MKRSTIILLAVGILLAAFLIYYQVRFQHHSIASVSMSPLLDEGEIVLVEKLHDELNYGDILVFDHDEGYYIFRLIGQPGDLIELKDGLVYINGIIEEDKGYKYQHKVITNGSEFNQKGLLKKSILSEPLVSNGYGSFVVNLTEVERAKLNKVSAVNSIQKIVHPSYYYSKESDQQIYPNTDGNPWSRDNFGPVKIPRKGMRIELNSDDLSLYISPIKKEGNIIEQKDGKVFINSEPSSDYTFKQDHYWVMGDNRHQALDSRYWGFVAEDEIIGVYLRTLLK